MDAIASDKPEEFAIKMLIDFDPVVRHTLCGCLLNLRRGFGITVLMTTRDMEEAVPETGRMTFWVRTS